MLEESDKIIAKEEMRVSTKKTKKVRRERMGAGRKQPSILDNMRRRGQYGATKELIVGVKKCSSLESSQDEVSYEVMVGGDMEKWESATEYPG